MTIKSFGVCLVLVSLVCTSSLTNTYAQCSGGSCGPQSRTHGDKQQDPNQQAASSASASAAAGGGMLQGIAQMAKQILPAILQGLMQALGQNLAGGNNTNNQQVGYVSDSNQDALMLAFVLATQTAVAEQAIALAEQTVAAQATAYSQATSIVEAERTPTAQAVASPQATAIITPANEQLASPTPVS